MLSFICRSEGWSYSKKKNRGGSNTISIYFPVVDSFTLLQNATKFPVNRDRVFSRILPFQKVDIWTEVFTFGVTLAFAKERSNRDLTFR